MPSIDIDSLRKQVKDNIDKDGRYHSTDGAFISESLTRNSADGTSECYGCLMRSGRFDIYCFRRSWIVDRGYVSSLAIVFDRPISMDDIRLIIERYYDELFTAPSMFLFLLEEWLANRGYQAKVIVNPGASTLIRFLSYFDLKFARWGWKIVGMKVFKGDNNHTPENK